MNCIHFDQIHTSDNLFCSNSSPILELSVKFASQICHENINKPLDGAYLADFGIDIRSYLPWDVGLPTSESFAQMLQNCSGFVLLDSFRHHIKNIVHNGGSKFQIEMGFHSLFRYSFGHTLRKQSLIKTFSLPISFN